MNENVKESWQEEVKYKCSICHFTHVSKAFTNSTIKSKK